MKLSNWIKLAGINLLFFAVTIISFLPGPSNKSVSVLSIAAQWQGFFGLALLPFAAIWIIFEIKKLRMSNDKIPDWRPSYYLAIIATVIFITPYILFLIFTFQFRGILEGIPVLIVITLGLILAIRQIKKLKRTSTRQFYPAPLYLLTIPLIALITRTYIEEPLSDFSRDFAIQRSHTLISAIEDYKNEKGQYPESLQDLKAGFLSEIPNPGIIGITDFRYNKINDNYSISFTQWKDWGST